MIKIAGFSFRVTGIEASCYYEQRELFFVKKVHSKVADSLTMVPAIEIDLYPWGMGYSSVWLGPVTSIRHQGTQEKSCSLCIW